MNAHFSFFFSKVGSVVVILESLLEGMKQVGCRSGTHAQRGSGDDVFM